MLIPFEIRIAEIVDLYDGNCPVLKQQYFIKGVETGFFSGPYYVTGEESSELREELNFFFQNDRIYVPVTAIVADVYKGIESIKKVVMKKSK